MCPQDRCNSHQMCQPHESHQVAAPTRKPTLTRMPKITCLTTASHFTRTLPTGSARVSDQTVSRPTQTPSSSEPTSRTQPATPPAGTRPVPEMSERVVRQHRRSHAIVHGRLIPFCFMCGGRKEVDGSRASSEAPSADAQATSAVSERPALHTIQGFPYDLRRSRVEASRLMESKLWSLENPASWQGASVGSRECCHERPPVT